MRITLTPARLISSGLISSVLLAASLASGAAHASLQARDLDGDVSSVEAWYDSAINLTWLANANLADDVLSWDDANTWAASLNFVDAVHNITYSDWRLPTTSQPDPSCSDKAGGAFLGSGCNGSEMGHLFHNQAASLGVFSNLQAAEYWSATDASKLASGYAWSFNMDNGWQDGYDQSFGLYAWAVHSGDVGIPCNVTPVPEADTWMMLLAGLGLVWVSVKRRHG